MNPRIVNGWLVEDPYEVDDRPPPGIDYAVFVIAHRGMIATHMLSGVELVWSEPLDGVEWLVGGPDCRVHLRHPAKDDRTRPISAVVDWDGARAVIAGVIGVPVEELRQPRRPSPSENVLKG